MDNQDKPKTIWEEYGNIDFNILRSYKIPVKDTRIGPCKLTICRDEQEYVVNFSYLNKEPDPNILNCYYDITGIKPESVNTIKLLSSPPRWFKAKLEANGKTWELHGRLFQILCKREKYGKNGAVLRRRLRWQDASGPPKKLSAGRNFTS